MAGKPPPSIGGESSGESWTLITESLPMPKSKRDVVLAFERILNLGHVQEVQCKLGKPFQVKRYVQGKQESLDPLPDELLDSDLMGAARNAELEQFNFTTQIPPYEYLFLAFDSLAKKSLRPIGVVVRSFDSLSKWLGFPFESRSLFGLDVSTSKEMPVDGLLLVAAKPEDLETVAFSYRLELNIPSEVETHEPGTEGQPTGEEALAEWAGRPRER